MKLYVINSYEINLKHFSCRLTIRQVYHKSFAGGAFKIMKSQLGISFEKPLNNLYEDFIKIS